MIYRKAKDDPSKEPIKLSSIQYSGLRRGLQCNIPVDGRRVQASGWDELENSITDQLYTLYCRIFQMNILQTKNR